MDCNDTLFPSRFLQTCDIPLPSIDVEPFTLVIFGGAGDLSKRKLLPTLFHLFQEKELPKDVFCPRLCQVEDDGRSLPSTDERGGPGVQRGTVQRVVVG